MVVSIDCTGQKRNVAIDGYGVGVSVDVATGEIRVRHMLAVYAAGRVLNSKRLAARRSAR